MRNINTDSAEASHTERRAEADPSTPRGQDKARRSQNPHQNHSRQRAAHRDPAGFTQGRLKALTRRSPAGLRVQKPRPRGPGRTVHSSHARPGRPSSGRVPGSSSPANSRSWRQHPHCWPGQGPGAAPASVRPRPAASCLCSHLRPHRDAHEIQVCPWATC